MKSNSNNCPNCGEPYREAIGPRTTEDVNIMLDNQLHEAGLCLGSMDKAFVAYERLFGRKFAEPHETGAS